MKINELVQENDMSSFLKDLQKNLHFLIISIIFCRCAPLGFSQTVLGKIAMGLRVKYFMDFFLFSVAIVTYVLYGLVLTQTSLFVLQRFNL